MKNIPVLLTALCLLVSTMFAQSGSPEVILKVSASSGFLGMGKPHFVKVALATAKRDKELTSDNVNAADVLYFTIRNYGDWQIDEDFIKEELPKLHFDQDGASLRVDAIGSPVLENENSVLLLSCAKTLVIHKPFDVTFPLDTSTERATMRVPQDLWPGYAKFARLMHEIERTLADGKDAESIVSMDQVIQDRSLDIFPDVDSVAVKRLAAYRRILTDNAQRFHEALTSKLIDTKQKIASTEEFASKFTYVADNVANDKLVTERTREGAAEEAQKAAVLIARTRIVRDSLNQVLDEQLIRFIVRGSSGGRVDFKYKYLIETFACAYASLDFSDTSATALKVVVSEDLTTRLQKYNLMAAYETFLRVVNKRWSAKKPMFPDGFLQNLSADTAQFPLPYYSILKAVQHFYQKEYASAKTEIHQVMEKCYAYELTESIDKLRILINTIDTKVPPEVLVRITEGQRCEERGENTKAIEFYKDALLISEDYAPAAFALGKLYDKNGDSYTANNYFQKAVVADSQYYTAYRFLYQNFFKNANFKPMIDLLTQAVAVGNDFFDIHYYLGIAYNGSAQYDLAIGQYERALELNGSSIDANIQAGISFQNLKSYTKAREYFKRATTIDPENQIATENLKRLDELQKKF